MKKYDLRRSHGGHTRSSMRDEVWTVLSGNGKTIVDGMEQVVRPGDVVCVAAGCKHTLIAHTNMSIIEVQVGEEISKKHKQVFDLRA